VDLQRVDSIDDVSSLLNLLKVETELSQIRLELIIDLSCLGKAY
jgi:hypothetical protein